MPRPAPLLSRTPAVASSSPNTIGDQTPSAFALESPENFPFLEIKLNQALPQFPLSQSGEPTAERSCRRKEWTLARWRSSWPRGWCCRQRLRLNYRHVLELFNKQILGAGLLVVFGYKITQQLLSNLNHLNIIPPWRDFTEYIPMSVSATIKKKNRESSQVVLNWFIFLKSNN